MSRKNKQKNTPQPPIAPPKNHRPGKKQSGNATSKTQKRGTAMVALPVRVALAVVALLCVAVAAIVLANINAIDSYNEATASLNANIAYSKKPDADAQTLKTQLDQTNTQFDEAKRFGSVVAPETKRLIDFNSSISKDLADSTARKMQGGKNQSSSKANVAGSKASSGGNTEQGLSDAQRKQVEDTLKANQPNGAVSSEKKAPVNNGGNTNVKPW